MSKKAAEMSDIPSDSAAELGAEETDQLFRSNKKAKPSEFEAVTGGIDEVMAEQEGHEASKQIVPVDVNQKAKEPISYRDRLLGVNGRDAKYTSEEDKIMDDDDLSDDEPEEECAKRKDDILGSGVDIPRERQLRLCKP